MIYRYFYYIIIGVFFISIINVFSHGHDEELRLKQKEALERLLQPPSDMI